MTRREGAVLSAYTGIMLVKEFKDFHAYAEELMEHPIFTHEFASKELSAVLKERSTEEFNSIIVNQG